MKILAGEKNISGKDNSFNQTPSFDGLYCDEYLVKFAFDCCELLLLSELCL